MASGWEESMVELLEIVSGRSWTTNLRFGKASAIAILELQVDPPTYSYGQQRVMYYKRKRLQ